MTMTYDLRLHGGQVFLHGNGLTKVDLLIQDGRIAAIVEPGFEAAARETVELNGKLVLPGAIDPHVHLGKDIRVPKDSDDALLESASAAAGGITSMLVYLMSGESYNGVVPGAQQVMESDSHVDFGFHICVGSQDHVKEIPGYITDYGISSFKFFMNFRGEEGAYLGLPGNDDGYMYDVLGMAADHGAMINPHPENIELVWKLKGRPIDESRGPLAAWNASRPSFVEAEAVQRVAYMASVTGASVYAVHTSSTLALEAMRRQRESYGNLFVETCTHYLTLTTDSPAGTYGKVNPPLRETGDLESLWEALASGELDTVGSDHNARHRSFKEKDIWKASAGFPGTGGVLPLTLAEGLRRGIPLERLVDATSTRSAQLFGLYPRKGTIRVGSDADLAVVDLDGSYTINAETQHSGAEYTPWEGTEVPLRIVHTIVRGHFALRDGVLSETTTGTYLRRETSGATALATIAKEDQQ
ncbi:dihydroorotase [Kineosporia babensis]|uniref:Amidohydrolase family protein n=1 Tax=Kineosporia babensis TaxID=499548 RepID=A0A9X1NM45_9ACTN|nr:amidohydrolase family protein [Kineosporia babensis]MCD5316246.1 amidohydrolase family protein [Kineosporia babensis]